MTKAPVHKTTLRNGLRIITEQIPHSRSVAVGVWIHFGSRDETPEESGLAHFVEHMVFKGTKNRSVREIAASIDAIGGSLDAFTTREFVCYNAVVLGEHLELAVDILTDLVCNPVFPPDDIEKEKGVVLEEIKRAQDDPEDQVFELFYDQFWGGHPLGKPILGTRQTLRRFDRECLARFHQQVYVPDRMVVAAAGAVEHAQMVDLLKARLGQLSNDNGRRRSTGRPRPHPFRLIKTRKNVKQVHLCLGFPAFKASDEKRFAAIVLDAILGGCVSSRLFQRIREDLGLAYSVFSVLETFRDTGCLLIYAATSPESFQKLLEAVMVELRELKKNGVDSQELQRAKDHLRGAILLDMELTNSRMSRLAEQELYFGRHVALEKVIKRIEQVEAQQIHRVAHEVLRADRMALAALGPIEADFLERVALDF